MGPRCTAADHDQAGIEAPVLSLELDDPLEEEDEVWDTAMVEAVSQSRLRIKRLSKPRDRSEAHHSVKGGQVYQLHTSFWIDLSVEQ